MSSTEGVDRWDLLPLDVQKILLQGHEIIFIIKLSLCRKGVIEQLSTLPGWNLHFLYRQQSLPFLLRLANAAGLPSFSTISLHSSYSAHFVSLSIKSCSRVFF